MKKELLITLGIILFFISVSSIIHFTMDKSGTLKEDLEWYDNEVQKTGIDPNILLPSQKQPLAEQNWNYVDDFYTSDYVNPGIENIMFSRDWTTQRLVNTDVKSQIDPSVYLFRESNMFLILATFKTQYSYNSDPQDIGFIHIGYSNNFEVSCYYSISYLSNSKEYILQRGLLELNEYSTIPIRQNTKSVGFAGMPDLIYTFTCSAYPTDDNDLDNDMYFSLDLDFYTKIDHYSEKVQIGLNEFKLIEAYNKYSVYRKSIRYEGGNQ